MRLSKENYNISPNYNVNQFNKISNCLNNSVEKNLSQNEYYNPTKNNNNGILIFGSAGNVKPSKNKVSCEVQRINNTITNEIDSFNFDERVKQGQKIILEIMKSNKPLSQKKREITGVIFKTMPKTEEHLHYKSSLSKDGFIELLNKINLPKSQKEELISIYDKAQVQGFKDLKDFCKNYDEISKIIRMSGSFSFIINDILKQAAKNNIPYVEIRTCAVGQGSISPENLIKTITSTVKQAQKEIKKQTGSCPTATITITGYRGKGWEEEVFEHAKIAIQEAQKNGSIVTGFDIAGPETDNNISVFRKPINDIQNYNKLVKKGKIKGNPIGITIHAGECSEAGAKSVIEAAKLGINRIGHGTYTVLNPEAIEKVKQNGITIEVNKICNERTIPEHTRQWNGHHPIEDMKNAGIKTSMCSDHWGLCGNTGDAYLEFYIENNPYFKNWDEVKKTVLEGVSASFLADKTKAKLLDTYNKQFELMESNKIYSNAIKNCFN